MAEPRASSLLLRNVPLFATFSEEQCRLLAPCVPAAFGTWMLLLQRHGRLRLREVMTYAIGYATDGYPMLGSASAAVAAVAATFRDHWPSSADLYLRGGAAPAPGARFTNP